MGITLKDYSELSKKENKYVLVIIDGDKAAHVLMLKDKEVINAAGELILGGLLHAVNEK